MKTLTTTDTWLGVDSSHSASSQRGPASVLLADADRQRLERTERALSERGYVVCTSVAGADALEILTHANLDVTVVRAELPDMSQRELLQTIRVGCPNTPVILTRMDQDVAATVQAMKLGAADCLVEPVSEARLAKTIEASLAEQRARRWIGNTVQQRTIAGYNVVRVLGEGEMGLVLEVEQAGATYAMKLLKRVEDERQHQARMARFDREARALETLGHSNIVRLVEYGETQPSGMPFIVTEFLVGQTLREHIDSRSEASCPSNVKILKQVLSALSQMHHNGHLHRDLKPSNVMLCESGRAVLIDLGLVHISGSTLTRSLQLIGSPAYMAPEALMSSIFDRRAELFSLGVMAFELLTGVRPFVSDTLVALTKEISQTPHPRLREMDPSLPRGLEMIIDLLLAKRPEQRYQDAVDVLTDLEAFEAGRPLPYASQHETYLAEVARSIRSFTPGERGTSSRMSETIGSEQAAADMLAAQFAGSGERVDAAKTLSQPAASDVPEAKKSRRA